MRILNFGSMNIDYVYSVDHIVKPGETISSEKLELFCGGKGLNQSVALARAGAPVFHAGMVGQDGEFLVKTCEENGVDTRYIRRTDGRSGNAIIQVDASGENCIVLYGGANRLLDRDYIDSVLADFGTGDFLLVQNELNLVDYIIDRAFERGLTIAVNPSPYDRAIETWDLKKVSIFLINEIEGAQMTGESKPEEILKVMHGKYPGAEIVLTLGDKGAVCQKGGRVFTQPAFKAKAVDTTAAGDTFTGYYLTGAMAGRPTEESLRLAAYASSLAVSRKGASTSIPYSEEVMRNL
jgi:ribokinase